MDTKLNFDGLGMPELRALMDALAPGNVELYLALDRVYVRKMRECGEVEV